MQNTLRPAIVRIIVRVAVRVGYCLHLRGNGAHIPKDGLQPVHPVGGQGGNVYAVSGPRRPRGKHGDNLPPVRALALDVNAVIVAGLHCLQCVGQLHVELSHSHIEGHGPRRRFIGKEDAEW